MTLLPKIKIFVEWLPQGKFFFWADQPNLNYPPLVQVAEIKFRLFAQHCSSYYGSFIEVTHLNSRTGLSVSPGEALEFFLFLPENSLAEWQWSKVMLKLHDIAPVIKDILINGKWQPDFTKWQSGQRGWQIQWPVDLSMIDYPHFINEWAEKIIDEFIERNPLIKETWVKLLQSYPLLQTNKTETSMISSAEDWLELIGWQVDDAPFRTCLQLVEPDDNQSPWTLNIILQDKQNDSHLVKFGLIQDQLLDQMPPNWSPYVDRIQKDVTKFINLLPWLDSHTESKSTKLNPSLYIKNFLSEEEAWQFLDSGSIALVNAGYTIFLPKWWEEIKKLKPVLKAKTKSSVGSKSESLLGAQQLINFDWKLSIGDQELSEEEFRMLADKKRRLLHIRGKWVQVDPALLQEVLRVTRQSKNLSISEVLQMHFFAKLDDNTPTENPELEDTGRLHMEVELNSQLSKMLMQLNSTETLPLVEPSSAFHGNLRNYQRIGVSWLLFLRKFGLGGCLADDMGLGKTIQLIAYLLKVQENGPAVTPALLICPTSVLGNWQKELTRFAPELNTYLHYGAHRCKGNNFIPAVKNADLVITSYNLAHLDREELCSLEWDCICLDEAQNIKNVYTKQSTAIRKLRGNHRIALTGTPMENRLTELWSIMDFLNPGYLSSMREFNRRFVNVIESKQDTDTIEQLQLMISPLILRRVKNDPTIELDLPNKQEHKDYIPLTTEQASLYENIIKSMFERLEDSSGIARKGLILSTLTKLKQLCDHPALLLKENNLANIKERSNKIERLLEMVKELRRSGDSCLIFTHFIGMGRMLQHIIQEELSEQVFFLHGGTSKPQRDEMITSFQNQKSVNSCHIFILSLRAGGLGLNLTQAQHVFHYDRWWNPAVENQATDRAHRIGQKSHVQVHKFICLGTLEERIDELIERKQGLNDMIVGTGETWITELSTAELRQIFALRKEWI